MGDWLRGRALPSHGRGHWFETSIAHHRRRRGGRDSRPPLFMSRPCSSCWWGGLDSGHGSPASPYPFPGPGRRGSVRVCMRFPAWWFQPRAVPCPPVRAYASARGSHTTLHATRARPRAGLVSSVPIPRIRASSCRFRRFRTKKSEKIQLKRDSIVLFVP